MMRDDGQADKGRNAKASPSWLDLKGAGTLFLPLGIGLGCWLLSGSPASFLNLFLAVAYGMAGAMFALRALEEAVAIKSAGKRTECARVAFPDNLDRALASLSVVLLVT